MVIQVTVWITPRRSTGCGEPSSRSYGRSTGAHGDWVEIRTGILIQRFRSNGSDPTISIQRFRSNEFDPTLIRTRSKADRNSSDQDDQNDQKTTRRGLSGLSALLCQLPNSAEQTSRDHTVCCCLRTSTPMAELNWPSLATPFARNALHNTLSTLSTLSTMSTNCLQGTARELCKRPTAR